MGGWHWVLRGGFLDRTGIFAFCSTTIDLDRHFFVGSLHYLSVLGSPVSPPPCPGGTAAAQCRLVRAYCSCVVANKRAFQEHQETGLTTSTTTSDYKPSGRSVRVTSQ